MERNRKLSILVTRAMRVVVLIFTLCAVLLSGIPAQAASAVPPGQKAGKYSRWSYPSQIAYGPIESGSGNIGSGPAPGAFLTLPFMGPHYITSVFDHCGPNYTSHGRVCRYDGEIASASVGGPDPTFDDGFAQTPGGHDYLYYSGHDGYDYGLYFEPIAAAADGTIKLADWLVPGCHTCLSGQTVEIDHHNGLLSFYGHMSKIFVSKGQWVRRGQVIGISGMSGSATGPHLHFGLYYMNGNGPVDPFGWTGPGPDPYARDLGDLWLTGSPRFADIAMPHVTVTTELRSDDPTAIDVSWSSPGAGTNFNVFYTTTDGVIRSWTDGAVKGWTDSRGNGAATFHGKYGRSYWFWASVRTDLGWTDGGGSSVVKIPPRDPRAAFAAA
jgi:murein DD-endopeptidase MepM/ murein hydrolase activator NlpD